MEYKFLGNTDVKISALCLGCMSFGDPASKMHAWTLNADDSEKIIRHALELGINFFDTANCYSAGTSEEYLGRAVKRNAKRQDVVLASKVYFNDGHLSKEAINREIDGTLKRLGTDYLDLYIIHRYDYGTPVAETMEALDGLVKAGKSESAGRLGDVRIPVLQHAVGGEGQRTDDVFVYAEPLQPDVPRRRKRTYSDMQTNRRVSHSVQSSGGGKSGAADMGRRHRPRQNRQGGARKIRFDGRNRQGHSRKNFPYRGKVRHDDDSRHIRLAFRQRRDRPCCRRHKGKIS